MDKATAVIAALSAGKQPSTQQTNAWIDALLQSQLVQVEKSDSGGELSENGRKLARDARAVLDAYKTYGANKNGDNYLQEALWHLKQADISASSLDVDVPMDKDEASHDYRALVSSLRSTLEILWTSASAEGSGIFSDFTSFTRLSLADAAELLGEKAGNAADSLRSVEDEVQAGERDTIGRKRKSDEEEDEDADTRVKFEKTMDSAKSVGSATIGAGQAATAKASDLSERSSTRLRDAASKIAKRAREDSDYRQSLDTIFDLIQKWIKLTGDSAADASQSTSLESFINDPTPEKHLIQSIRCVRKLAEKVAGGKSLDDFFSALRTCVVDIRNDDALQKWTNDFLVYSKKNLDNVGEVDSEEVKRERQDLKRRWSELTDENSASGRKWKGDISKLKKELGEYQAQVNRDSDLHAIRKAHAKLGADLEDALFSAASSGASMALNQASWIWQDFFNVYLPRSLGLLKSIPIPRTEYKDPESEFVLEDLDISSLSLLPGHVFIRNITDIDITAPENEDTTTAVGSLTHVKLQGLQLALKEISFYYHDKSASLGPGEFTGIVAVTLPPQGIDVDIKVRLIPSTPEGLKEREQRARFHHVELVDAKVNDDVDFQVKSSNHPVLLSVFKPLLNSRLRETLQTVIREQIQTALESLDSIAYDISKRSEVFEDAGLTKGPALAAGFWSELGHFRRLPGGWSATGTGIVRDMPKENAQFAMGAEPQVISGEKRGPKGNLSEPLKNKAAAAAPDVDVDMDSASDQAKGVAGQVKQTVQQGVQKVRAFKNIVEEKKEEEERQPGWKSSAFDL
ncbi:hypothetical protein FA95DRAFT_1569893 [Auriscalpium vulgare]|uniref:Uncharacterized protein n=1 Tax=Auriscalpium vulgare TaxID=40419 RepID=A0ACB8S629_9AGAM|nr:hypothetical protein FA95DRAFT_1569893 [Auriscalpium vulgare]